jgi:hypothetical protein
MYHSGMLSRCKIGFLRLLFVGAWMVAALPVQAQGVDAQIRQLTRQAPTLNPHVLRLGLRAYEKIRKAGWDQRQMLTIVDYSKPSSEARLWVLNLRNNRVLFNDYVSHAKKSGDRFARRFSNQYNSFQSSLGVFLATRPYFGRSGYSLRLVGLEKGINDRVFSRHIVFHGSKYVTQQFVRRYRRVGRSWGCFAVSPRIIYRLINTIKGGTLVFAYYPDKRWLSHSRFLA